MGRKKCFVVSAKHAARFLFRSVFARKLQPTLSALVKSVHGSSSSHRCISCSFPLSLPPVIHLVNNTSDLRGCVKCDPRLEEEALEYIQKAEQRQAEAGQQRRRRERQESERQAEAAAAAAALAAEAQRAKAAAAAAAAAASAAAAEERQRAKRREEERKKGSARAREAAAQRTRDGDGGGSAR